MAEIKWMEGVIMGTVAVGGGTLINTYLLQQSFMNFADPLTTMVVLGINVGTWVGGIGAVIAYDYFLKK